MVILNKNFCFFKVKLVLLKEIKLSRDKMSKYIILIIRIMRKAGQSWNENTNPSIGVFKATFLNCINKWKRMSEKTLYFQQALKRHP